MFWMHQIRLDREITNQTLTEQLLKNNMIDYFQLQLFSHQIFLCKFSGGNK